MASAAENPLENFILTSCTSREAFGRLVQRVTECSKLTIFMVGNVGSGKSTLVNSLLGCEAAETGSTLEPVTREVNDFDDLVRVQGPIGKITTTVWDSPGLQDPDVDKEILLKKISEKCVDVDLVVYCIPMTKIRMDVGEVSSICDVTKALGVKVWENALFVLTFANQLELPKKYEKGCDLREYFFRRKEEWSQSLHKKLTSHAGVESEIANKVPVVVAGYEKEPLSNLKEDDDWYLEFWSTCCERVMRDAFPAFLMTSVRVNSLLSSKFFSSEEFKAFVAKFAATDRFLGWVKTMVTEFNVPYSDLAQIWPLALQKLEYSMEQHIPQEQTK